MANLATTINRDVENIGARRLHTIMERLTEDLSFAATERAGVSERQGALAGARLGKRRVSSRRAAPACVRAHPPPRIFSIHSPRKRGGRRYQPARADGKEKTPQTENLRRVFTEMLIFGRYVAQHLGSIIQDYKDSCRQNLRRQGDRGPIGGK